MKLVALAWHVLRNHETEAFLIEQGEPFIPFYETRPAEILRTIRALVVIILIGMLAEPDGEHRVRRFQSVLLHREWRVCRIAPPPSLVSLDGP